MNSANLSNLAGTQVRCSIIIKVYAQVHCVNLVGTQVRCSIIINVYAQVHCVRQALNEGAVSAC
jgi:hypothetical protein